MKRAIPRSVLEQMKASRAAPDEDTKAEEGAGLPGNERESVPGGFGGAWKAGAMAQVEGDLTQLREDIVEAVVAGERELSLDPTQVDDPLGSDRRPDWEETDAFVALLDSIRRNGQDVPVQVWPADPTWRPDPRDPLDASGQKFHLLSGRRRRAVCDKLKLPLRAVIVPAPEGGSDAENRFAMLFHRFRENEAREDLSAFERLLSVGEIYEALKETGEDLTAVAFAERIGVHESMVSRARAVLRHKDAILNTFKTPYEMSFRALQNALSELETAGKKPKKKPAPKAPKGVVKAEVSQGGRTLKASLKDKTVTIRLSHVDADTVDLEKALAKFAAALPSRQSRKKKGRPMVD